MTPPLRPSPEDVTLMEREVRAWSTFHAGASAVAVLMGVTPEVPSWSWPEGSQVIGVDRSLDMIRHVWPASARFAAGVVAADWRAMPLRDGFADIVVGDGVFTMFAWPSGYREILLAVSRLLRPGGRLINRFHVRPDRSESVDAVLADLRAGRIGSFHVFKWRLAMVLHGEGSDGVRLGDVWEAWQACGIAEAELCRLTGWPHAVVASMHAYRDSDARYRFPTLAQVHELCAERFLVRTCHFPSYELGERFPIMSLEPRAAGA